MNKASWDRRFFFFFLSFLSLVVLIWWFSEMFVISLQACNNTDSVRSVQRRALSEKNVDTLVSTLTRRGNHYRDSPSHIVSLKIPYGNRTWDACMTGEAVRRSSHCATFPSLNTDRLFTGEQRMSGPSARCRPSKSPRTANVTIRFPNSAQIRISHKTQN